MTTEQPEGLAPQAARLAPKLRGLADEGIYFGTSSWKYPGWVGSIYTEDRYRTRGKFSKKKFEQECLQEYSRVFPAVCGDFAFYQFPTREYWQRLFEAVPGDFKLAAKVPEDITVAVWPQHDRRAGTANENFLNASAFADFFAKPLERYGDQVGPLIFEFGTFNKKTFPTPGDFYDRLDVFLASLPKGFRYALEIRNPEYLAPVYFDVLAAHNVAHVLNAWTRMPPLDEQAQLPGVFTADFTVVRALLRRGRSYSQAVSEFDPYERIQEPNEGARAGMVTVGREARKRKIPAFLFVNNRLEGNAPGTIEAVSGELL